ncbi:hypothetical protein DFH11DRAFT_436700 [Phellopilus nigrolimitatus]|nr:hypothetical protein DFH11DRAFT_436700 [Phellopilus nigrolimitatus]
MAPRGNENNNRGRGRGSPFRGRPWRGHNSPRGRGARGGPESSRPAYRNLDLIDVDIQQYSDVTVSGGSPAQRGFGRGRGRGRGRGFDYRTFDAGNRSPPPPRRNVDSGSATPSGRGNGRGPARGLGAKYNANMSLSKLLALDRPYLRPITFVPAQQTPVLFQRPEEIFEVEELIEPEEHVPTADKVARVFSHQKPPEPSFFYNPDDDLLGGNDAEPVITVDFNSLGKLMESTTTTTSVATQPTRPKVVDEGASIFGAIRDALANGATTPQVTEPPADVQAPEIHESVTNVEQQSELEIAATANESVSHSIEVNAVQLEEEPIAQPLFVIDPKPVSPSDAREEVAFLSTLPSTEPLGSKLPDDDEVVYVAPHPRCGKLTPCIGDHNDAAVPPPSPFTQPVASTSKHPFNEMSFSFGAVSKVAEANRQHVASPRSRRITKMDRMSARIKMEQGGFFGTYGAMLEEKHLREDAPFSSKRREGSDIDWGDAESLKPSYNRIDDSDVERVSSSLGGMELDPDVDIEGMRTFAKGMSNEGMEHKRIDDLEDVDSSSSSDEDDEIDAVIAAQEEFIGDPGDFDTEGEEEDDDEISSDEEETPKRSFQARLVKVRQNAMKKMKASAVDGPPTFQNRLSAGRGREKTVANDGSNDSDDDFDANFTWVEQDESFLEGIHDLLDENDDILSGRDRKQRKALFNAIRDGEFTVTPAKKKRDYGKDLPPELKAQWEGDRAKKAENKRKRAAARVEAASDPFAPHKGGKKAINAMLRASRLAAETEAALPSRAFDVQALVRQIRTFLAGATQQMALPPMDKLARAKVHEIADAFGLKSVSKGKGEARYTTLVKTKRSGARVQEWKIERIVRSGGDWGFTRPGNPGSGGGKGKGGGPPRHKEGEEVGKEAPKIGEGNVGFRLLANMGWAEGERIGSSGGLDVPLAAIIKNTKLGLGAMR